MALINCPECGKEISDTCESCIHCGYKLIKITNIEKEQTSKKKLLSKPIIIVATVSVIVLLIIVLVVNKSLHTYSYEEEVCYNAVKYFYTLFDSPEDFEISDIYISPITSSPIFIPKGSNKKYYGGNIIAISYMEKNSFGTKDLKIYYIKMTFNYAQHLNGQEILQQEYYSNNSSNKINLKKINYALKHPEVLEK